MTTYRQPYLDSTVYNPMVVRRCPRCYKRNSQFTEGGRIKNGADETIGENPRARRDIVCVACGHKWSGKLTRSERGIE